MEDKTRNILRRPFDKSLIKTRKGPGGKQLSYVELQHFIDRLNEAFGHDWSHEIVCREQFENQVVVEVRLTAGGISKTGIGGSTIRRSKNDSQLLSLADDFKMAEADAIKRAARSFGMASELYRDTEDISAGPAQEELAANENGPADQQRGRISTAQIAKLRELVGELGSDWGSFRKWYCSERGSVLEYSSRAEASAAIEDLIGRLRRKRSMNGSGPHAVLDGGQHDVS